jgi:putative membrane protein
MKKRFLIPLLALAIVALFAFACKKSENENYSTTDTSTTSTSATDTSGTTSTMDTSGTSGTSGTPGTAPAVTSTSPMGKEDQDTATKIAQANQAEIDAGTLAATKATNADVKNFANKMVADHGKAGDELKQLASAKGLTLPTQTDDAHKKAIDKLSTTDPKKFDKAYMEEMVKGHEEAVKAFEKTSKDAKDPDLKSWATKTLPTVQDHLKMAKEINGKLK